MPDHFHTVLEALKETADGLIAANVGIKRVADAVLLAREDHQDREESIAHLESLVLALSADVRALKDRLDGPQHP
jgi:hypothetical protein